MPPSQHIVAIYQTNGSIAAYLVYPYIYNLEGEWIGWVARNRQVYSVQGTYVGWVSDDTRILRKQSTAHIKPRLTPPPPPGKFVVPELNQKPPKMADLRAGTFDVLERASELLPPRRGKGVQSEID